MARLSQFPIHGFVRRCFALRPAFAVGVLLTGSAFAAHGQTFSVLHLFTGGGDGGQPKAGVIADPAGNLYGTTFQGGNSSQGVVYKYNPQKQVLTPLFWFNGAGGANPDAPVLRDPASGVLYGTAEHGGTMNYGVAYELSPGPSRPVSVISPWLEPKVYSFGSGADGRTPVSGLIEDSAGNLYGTTNAGGNDISQVGTVFELSPAGNGWAETILYSFNKSNDVGCYPDAPVVFDSAGNLFGTANLCGGEGKAGTVYELVHSGSSWMAKQLHAFDCATEGCLPTAGLVFDPAGNLYGATTTGGPNGGGTVFELSPSNGGWTFHVLWSFSETGGAAGPASTLALDAEGNLYGATQGWIDGNDPGHVFKLVYSNGSWTEQILHQFSGGPDGSTPLGSVLLDKAGNIFGTAELGGESQLGTLWEITP